MSKSLGTIQIQVPRLHQYNFIQYIFYTLYLKDFQFWSFFIYILYWINNFHGIYFCTFLTLLTHHLTVLWSLRKKSTLENFHRRSLRSNLWLKAYFELRFSSKVIEKCVSKKFIDNLDPNNFNQQARNFTAPKYCWSVSITTQITGNLLDLSAAFLTPFIGGTTLELFL